MHATLCTFVSFATLSSDWRSLWSNKMPETMFASVNKIFATILADFPIFNSVLNGIKKMENICERSNLNGGRKERAQDQKMK